MDDKDRMQRVIGLEAIKAKAEELIREGKDPFEVKTFVSNARGELARQKPDWQQYERALRTAEKVKGEFF